MEEQISQEEAERMFHLYAELLNREFHDKDNAKNTTDECMAIASDLLESGLVIIVRFQQKSEIIQLSDDTMQTLITFEYDLALVKHQIPIGQPLAVDTATTKIFGPPAAITHMTQISEEDETWLRWALGSMDINDSEQTGR